MLGRDEVGRVVEHCFRRKYLPDASSQPPFQHRSYYISTHINEIARARPLSFRFAWTLTEWLGVAHPVEHRRRVLRHQSCRMGSAIVTFKEKGTVKCLLMIARITATIVGSSDILLPLWRPKGPSYPPPAPSAFE